MCAVEPPRFGLDVQDRLKCLEHRHDHKASFTELESIISLYQYVALLRRDICEQPRPPSVIEFTSHVRVCEVLARAYNSLQCSSSRVVPTHIVMVGVFSQQTFGWNTMDPTPRNPTSTTILSVGFSRCVSMYHENKMLVGTHCAP